MRAIEPTGFPRRTSKRFVAAGVLFMAVLGIASASASREPQLGALAGLTDEYFMLGAKLRVNGTLGLSREEPSALRPPGYPAFVAAVLWAFVTHPARVEASVFEARAARALHMAQAFVLALSSVALLLWLSGPLRLDAALAAGALVGLNPWSLALVGLHHYDLLHWLTLIAACWATDRALRCRRPRLGLTAAGALWGVSNLVRPTTLLLPAFVLVASWLWQRRSLGSSFTRALCLALGMAVAIAPWVVRNHAVTGRFVAVADNPWGTLWGQTVRPLAPDANHYTWLELYRDDLLPLFARVADASRYDYVLHSRHNAEFEAALREKALRNLRERPLGRTAGARAERGAPAACVVPRADAWLWVHRGGSVGSLTGFEAAPYHPGADGRKEHVLPTRIIIMGAAGRDFHNFNTVFRDGSREPRRRLHRDADPEHRGAALPEGAGRPALPGRNPDLRRIGAAAADRASWRSTRWSSPTATSRTRP